MCFVPLYQVNKSSINDQIIRFLWCMLRRACLKLAPPSGDQMNSLDEANRPCFRPPQKFSRRLCIFMAACKHGAKCGVVLFIIFFNAWTAFSGT